MYSARSSLGLMIGMSAAALSAIFSGCSDDAVSIPEPNAAHDAGEGASVDATSRAPEADATAHDASDSTTPNLADAGLDGTWGPDAADASDALAIDAAPEPTCDDAGASTLPTHLWCTGLYQSWNRKQLAPSAREYAPAYALWSDGATKRRWVQLPAGSQIDTSNMDEWSFPVGTKFWKEFAVNGKRIETRFMWKTADYTWLRTTYRWTANEDDAIRFDTGSWGPDGGFPPGADVDAGDYEIPSVDKCDECHNGRVDSILGFEAINLGLPGASGITLAQLVSDNWLSVNPPVANLTLPDDSTNLARPAIGWLHSNCGLTCHNTSPGATCGFRGMNLRIAYNELHPADGGAPAVANLALFKTTKNVTAALPNSSFKRIAPGSPSTSAISYFISRRDGSDPDGQMPPIVSHVVDTTNVAAIQAWIAALPP